MALVLLHRGHHPFALWSCEHRWVSEATQPGCRSANVTCPGLSDRMTLTRMTGNRFQAAFD